MMKKPLIIILSLFVFLMTGCEKKEEIPQENIPEIKDVPIQHESEFGGIYIEETIEDFNALGFEFGDSVDITFSNGASLSDIPYYNGYYVDAGEALLVGYPGYDFIKVTLNY